MICRACQRVLARTRTSAPTQLVLNPARAVPTLPSISHRTLSTRPLLRPAVAAQLRTRTPHFQFSTSSPAAAAAAESNPEPPQQAQPRPEPPATPPAATPPEKPDYLDAAESAIWDRLVAAFAPAELSVRDVSGGCGSMYSIDITSQRFRGAGMLKQQRMVNAELADLMAGWHGVQLRTKAP